MVQNKLTGAWCLIIFWFFIVIGSAKDGSASVQRYTLTQGQEFSLPLDRGLVLHLAARDSGWVVSVEPSVYPHKQFPDGAPNLAAVTPPLHGPNATDIQGWHFRNSDNSGPNAAGSKNVNAPGMVRSIQYCQTVEEFLQWEKDYDEFQSGRCLQAQRGCFPSAGCRHNLELTIHDVTLGNLGTGRQARMDRMEFSFEKTGSQ